MKTSESQEANYLIFLTEEYYSLLPPANEVCEGYVFTPVCQSFCSQGGSASVHAGIADPQDQETPSPGPDPPGTRPPPREQTLPPCSACWESGRYVSYWNAYIFVHQSFQWRIHENYMKKKIWPKGRSAGPKICLYRTATLCNLHYEQKNCTKSSMS